LWASTSAPGTDVLGALCTALARSAPVARLVAAG
jgi:hypothetical protein